MKLSTLTIAGCVFLIFSTVAFHQINNQGILYHDAGMCLLEAKFVGESLQTLVKLGSGKPHGKDIWQEIKSTTTGVPIHAGKPGYNVIVWLGSLIAGFHDTLSAKVTAVAGIFGIFLVFLISRRLGGDDSAICSATALASSTFYLVFSRSGLADTVVSLFFLLGLYIYVRGRYSSTTARYWVGLCFGYAFSSNHWRASYIVLILGLLETVYAFLEHWNWKTWLQRLTLIGAGFVTPILLFQIPYVIARSVLGPLPFHDYWAQLVNRLEDILDVRWFLNMTELSREYWKVEGGLFPLLVFLAWIFLGIRFLIKRRPEDLLLLFYSPLPFFYFSALQYGNASLPRLSSLTLPISALCAGEFLAFLKQKLEIRFRPVIQNPLGITPLIVTLLLGYGIPRQLSTGITRTGYAEASQYLARTGESKFMILTMEPIWRFYLGRVAYEPYDRPQSLRELVAKSRAAGINYVTVDFETIHKPYGLGYTVSLFGKVKPRAVFPNPKTENLAYLLDDFGLVQSQEILKDTKSHSIYIFNINDISGALEQGILTE